jgi:protein phosphatase 1G
MDELIASQEGKKELHRLKNKKDRAAGSSIESNAGCTANVLLIVDGTLFIANAGDSRCYLQNPHQILALSEDHKPENPKEL